MATTPYMGLTKWSALIDVFSHTQLATNFDAIDAHDHSAGQGVQIPEDGLATSAVSTTKLADASVTTDKLAPSSVTLAKVHGATAAEWEYAYSQWRPLHERSYRFDAPTSAGGPYLLLDSSSGGSGVNASAAGAAIPAFYWDPVDRAAGSRTIRLRIRGTALVNATAPSCTFTIGLYPVNAVAGGAATTSITLGTVNSSTVAFASPSANSLNQAVSTEITGLTAGFFVLGVAVSTNAAANSAVAIRAALQIKQA